MVLRPTSNRRSRFGCVRDRDDSLEPLYRNNRSFLDERPDLAPLLEDLRQFKVCGELMLTGIKHGLDAKNLDTTATVLEDGSSVLHTPATGTAKAMPPTTALAGIPRVAVVLSVSWSRARTRTSSP